MYCAGSQEINQDRRGEMDKELMLMNLLNRLINIVEQIATMSNVNHAWIARELKEIHNDYENLANGNG